MSSVFDELETAGHDLTFLGMSLGVSAYYCENCGAFMKIGGGTNVTEIILFHLPRISTSGTREKCCGHPPHVENHVTMKQKLKVLEDESMERLRRI